MPITAGAFHSLCRSAPALATCLTVSGNPQGVHGSPFLPITSQWLLFRPLTLLPSSPRPPSPSPPPRNVHHSLQDAKHKERKKERNTPVGRLLRFAPPTCGYATCLLSLFQPSLSRIARIRGPEAACAAASNAPPRLIRSHTSINRRDIQAAGQAW
jgi:hypothetical protein